MDVLTSMKISSSALSANKKRLGAISSNIANAQTTQTQEGGPYRRKVVVFESRPVQENFSETLENEINRKSESVRVKDVVSLNEPPHLKYEPSHPHANKDGYVAYPKVNVMTEMADLISAQRSYEANISAFKTSKSMALKSLEIGK